MLNVAVLTSNRCHPSLDVLLAHPDVDVAAVLTPVPPTLRDRQDHDAKLAAELTALDIDLVVCLGYLYILTEPMLTAFRGRILNLHDGEARFPGLHATRDAIVAGARETRSMIHVVDETLDGGPVLFTSRPYPVAPFVHDAVRAEETKIVKAYVYAHREWMIRDAWPSLLNAAIGRSWCSGGLQPALPLTEAGGLKPAATQAAGAHARDDSGGEVAR
jgi:folate-dependent phosphoribosylglycinamide formyltransferase PurN